MRTEKRLYLKLKLSFLLLAGLLAAAWWGAAQLPAVRAYLAGLLAQSAAGAQEGASARYLYPVLTGLLPGAVSCVLLMAATRLVEQRLFGDRMRAYFSTRHGDQRLPLYTPLLPYVLAELSGMGIRPYLADRRVIAQLALADPYRRVSVLQEGETYLLPLYMQHPEYDALYMAASGRIDTQWKSGAWLAAFFLTALLDLLLRLRRRRRMEREEAG